jgi:hypothetical protein
MANPQKTAKRPARASKASVQKKNVANSSSIQDLGAGKAEAKVKGGSSRVLRVR